MDWMTIIQLAIQYGPTIKGIVDEATSNHQITDKIKATAPDLAGMLEQVGSQFFPKAAPALHIAAAAMAGFDPSGTKWIQNACNSMLEPSPDLDVDGIYGPKTRAAVERLQAQLGIAVDGVAGQITQAAISAVLGGHDD